MPTKTPALIKDSPTRVKSPYSNLVRNYYVRNNGKMSGIMSEKDWEARHIGQYPYA
jgi:hypothetical protein